MKSCGRALLCGGMYHQNYHLTSPLIKLVHSGITLKLTLSGHFHPNNEQLSRYKIIHEFVTKERLGNPLSRARFSELLSPKYKSDQFHYYVIFLEYNLFFVIFFFHRKYFFIHKEMQNNESTKAIVTKRL